MSWSHWGGRFCRRLSSFPLSPHGCPRCPPCPRQPTEDKQWTTELLHLSLTRKTFIRVHPHGNPAGVHSVARMTRSHCRSPVSPPYFRTILITKCAVFQRRSLQTTHSLSVCVYNIGVFCLYRKINATTPSLSGLFKFPKTFRTTFLSVLAEEAITKITAVFSFLHRDSPLFSVSTGEAFRLRCGFFSLSGLHVSPCKLRHFSDAMTDDIRWKTHSELAAPEFCLPCLWISGRSFLQISDSFVGWGFDWV